MLLPPEFPDSKVLKLVFSISGAATATWLLPEVSGKLLTDNLHLTPGKYFLYFGASTRDQYSRPWFVWFGLCSLLPYTVSLIVLKVLKLR